MIRIIDENANSVSVAFGFTEREDVNIKLCVLKNIMNPEHSKFTDVMSISLNELTNELPPSFELIASVAFHAGLYAGKVRCDRAEELIVERFMLENYQG